MRDRLAPGFLFAVPQLRDPNFLRTVVLLIEHGESGSFGIVLNQEIPAPLETLCREQNIPYAADPTKRVRRGGPVQPEQGFVLFGDEAPDPEGRAVGEHLQFSASRTTLGRLCARPGARFHCYLGYAGWGPGQLTEEITAGAWIVGPADAALALDAPPAEMWERGLRSLGIDPATLVLGSATEA